MTRFNLSLRNRRLSEREREKRFRGVKHRDLHRRRYVKRRENREGLTEKKDEESLIYSLREKRESLKRDRIHNRRSKGHLRGR